MSSYRPKSLDELNNMYDKALSAQRAIKRGTSKINESNSSESFFDDIIKDAELTLDKEPEKRIADLSVAVDDFIKHFSEPDKKSAEAFSENAQPKVKLPETHKAAEASKIKTEKKPDPIVATPSPIIARKQSGEHISNLMSDYIRIMNDQDDSDEDEPKQRKSFLSRKKDKKTALKEHFMEEASEELADEPTYTPLSDELKEEVFPFEAAASSDKPAAEESAPSAASEEAFNAFSAMNKAKESFHNEIVKDEPEAKSDETDEEEPSEDEADSVSSGAEAEEADKEVEADGMFDDISSESENADDEEEQEDEEAFEEEPEEEISYRSKSKNALRVTARIFLSLICTATLILSIFCASLSTVLNVNTGKEVLGKYYFFTSSHDFVLSHIKAGDLVLCEKKSTVSDDETAVYIDLENKTFSFGLKDGSMTNEDGDIIYFIDENEIERDDVLGTVYKTVPLLGDAITLVYEYYVPVIAVLVSVTAVLLLVIIFALKKRKPEEAYEEETEEDAAEEEQQEETEAFEENEEEVGADIFAELD